MMNKIKIGFRVIGTSLIPLLILLDKYPHWLLTGPSGSGKSYLIKYLFWSLFQITDLEIFCCDFKNSGDYDFMDKDHLAVGMECTDMVTSFYARYMKIKENNLPNRILLVFDEWAAFMLWAEGKDKRMATEMKDIIQETLMVGRKLGGNGGGAYIWIVLQRPDAAFFGSSRENFFVKIIMKDITKSIRTMLDIDEKDIPKEHIPVTGHGICVLDNSIYPFIVPSYDPEAMDALLKAEAQAKAVSRAECCLT